MGFAKANKLWDLYRGTSTQQEYLKKAKATYPEGDAVCLRHMWYAFDVASEAQRQPQPRRRERLGEPPREATKRGSR